MAMIFSTAAVCCVSILILTIPLPTASAPTAATDSTSELAKKEVALAHSMYEDAASSDPHFPWTYARVKRQLYKEYIPRHRPLSGNIYAMHAGFPHPGRWDKEPGSIMRPDPNSGHHFDSPNVILTEADFQRYGSTLQHLDNQIQQHAPVHGNEYGAPVSQGLGNEYGAPVPHAFGNEYGAPVTHALGNEYGAPVGHAHGGSGYDSGAPVVHGHAHSGLGYGSGAPVIQSHAHAHGGKEYGSPGAAIGGGIGGGDYGNEPQTVGPIVEHGIVHHNGKDLPVKILHHHHYHDPIVLDPIVHAIDPKDQNAIIEFNQGGGGGLPLGHGHGHGQNQLVIPEGQIYGHGHGGSAHGDAIVEVQAPVAHQPHPVPVPVSVPIVQSHGGYTQQIAGHGHGVQEEGYGIGHGEEEISHALKFRQHAPGHAIGHGHAHSDAHGQEELGEHAYGFGHPHAHLASLKNKPLSHLFNFHNLFFGPSRKPTHHTPILKSLWPSAYGKWRHRPFSWQFSY